MTKRSVTPSIGETAFDCPHCGAYTTQTWFDFSAVARSDEHRVPYFASQDALDDLRTDRSLEEAFRNQLIENFEMELRGLVFLTKNERAKYFYIDVHNLHLSKCFNCGESSIWIHENLVFPTAMQAPPPNEDLPDGVRIDYLEAGRVIAISPRGAAALLRLAIQKLCVSLGEKGGKLDDDIANLVQKGLSPLVQKSLDSVRVIGNEAVHPGTLDLKDDVSTATSLFKAVNIIAEQMISNQKHAEELYEKLPDAKKRAIADRDKK